MRQIFQENGVTLLLGDTIIIPFLRNQVSTEHAMQPAFAVGPGTSIGWMIFAANAQIQSNTSFLFLERLRFRVHRRTRAPTASIVQSFHHPI